MRKLRLALSLVIVALLAIGCRPTPLAVSTAVAPASQPVLTGQVLLPEGYGIQATAGQVRANATVTLIDPSTFQAKGTGITAPDGTFTVQALGTFTPTIGSLYLLESSKTLGGTSNSAFRLRTLVQFNAGGWTSVSGTAIQLSATTTAVAILWDHLSLGAADVIGKVSKDAVTGVHQQAGLTASVPELLVRSVESLVSQALLLNLDPVQIVRPGPDGAYRLSFADQSRNMLANAGFEEGGANPAPWRLNAAAGVATYSFETLSPHEGRQAMRFSATAAGDSWFGQGYNGADHRWPLKLEAGRAYTYSVYARGAAGGEKLALAFNYQDPFLEVRSDAFTLTTAWQRYSWTFTPAYSTPKAIALIRFGTGIGQTVGATCYADAAQLEEGAPTDFRPQGSLVLEGFANARESVGVTPVEGRSGTAVFIDRTVNQLANSSFERDSDADGIPDGMSRTAASIATYSLDVDALFHGRSLKIDKTTSGTAEYVKFNHAYTYEAGKTYTFSVWVKGKNVSGSQSSTDFGLYVDPYLPDASLSGVDVRHVAAPVGTFDWTQISLTHTFLNTCTAAALSPIFRNKTGTVWFDGFQVEQGPKATPYGGEPGHDRLTFDAYRYVNKRQGAIAFWYQPTYAWNEGDFKLLSIDGTNSPKWPVLYLAKLGETLTLRTHGGPGFDWDAPTTWTPASQPWKPGEWHHLAITWGPQGKDLYFDGEKVATGAFSGSINGASPLNLLSFACNEFLSVNVFSVVNPQGALDGLKVWDAQRSSVDIRRTYLGIAP
ncbi:MAG TPA: LamG-like jellyroll fold domain-containing protein [Pantanalinema sp.]